MITVMDTSFKTASRQPKYLEIAEAIKADIVTGRLGQNERLASFAELRTRYGATPTTVNQVYGVLEREGLITRERGRGVFVGASRHAATGIMALAGTHFRNHQQWAYWDAIFHGIESVASDAGFDILLVKNGSNSIQFGKVDGVIFSTEDLLRHLPAGVPRVSLLAPIEGAASVSIDDYQGMSTAMGYLLSQGHRKIAYLGINSRSGANANSQSLLSDRRLSAYRDCLTAAGIEVDSQRMFLMPTPLSPDGTSFGGKDVMTGWLRGDWLDLGCTALVAHNDDLAIGALEALIEAGVDVPGQVSVVGFDGIETSDQCVPRLTTVEVPLRQIGAMAAELLIRQIRAEAGFSIAEPTCTLLPTRLRICESTAPPRRG